MRNGIMAGGNLIVDNIKIVDYYPNKNMMCNIVQDVIVAIGGGPHNVLVTLAKLNAGLDLSVLGLVGNDSGADIILKDFAENNIKTDYVQKINYKNTSFTDVIVEKCTGERTFMHYPGANSELDFHHFEKAKDCNAKIFYLGNLLHLDRIDSDDEEFGLVSARVMNHMSNLGFKTGADMVSVKSDLFKKVYQHTLKHLDYLILNDIEAESLTNLKIRIDDSNYDKENLEKAAHSIISAGVREYVFIHFPEGGYAMDKGYKSYFSPAYSVKREDIKSTVGCGDAFSAGCLYSLHQDLPIIEALKMGNACARFCLFDNTTTGGATTLENIKTFLKSFE